MSKEEMKHEIGKVLDHFPNDAIQELLVFLKHLEKKHKHNTINADFLQRILQEDKELLEKLAQ